MNQIEQFFKDSNGSFAGFSRKYAEYICELIKSVEIEAVEKLVDLLIKTREHDSIVFIIGNGGSAATASHFAEDLALCAGAGPEKPLRALSLSDSAPYITALGNDEGYENVFLGQLRNLYKPDDILIVFTASGNSPNVLKAIEYVNAKGGETFGFLGFDGGKAKQQCTQSITIETPKGYYGPVESMHLLLIHVVSNYLFFRLSGKIKKL
ncbi:hypothetical protein A3F19_02840 [Candidatus Nomurabacteria bacterium RIFCSPHIGHO2_12_FULL_37_29]|uniref:SIS domain-containing protein n=2 Tax=Parcubacteria group TaxID=1794811 RepID=A0A1G2UNE6_9BACT|nr:MAG: hypothetical protein A3F19_02840 [Candidatus Nomurabacteria bacterium RIFCSPHIGHO2_12_FULL_37_29]OHB10895.1 MAG: hypothetical protein A3H60_02080 [Candidatus Zambryskibacteria bacterium RIFCSPLOWO2_02_FULL_44_12b]